MHSCWGLSALAFLFLGAAPLFHAPFPILLLPRCCQAIRVLVGVALAWYCDPRSVCMIAFPATGLLRWAAVIAAHGQARAHLRRDRVPDQFSAAQVQDDGEI